MVRSLRKIRTADTEAAVVPQEYTIRVVGAAAGELFTLFSLMHAISGNDVKSIPVCLLTFALVLLPSLAERIFRCHMRSSFGLPFPCFPVRGRSNRAELRPSQTDL